MALPEQRWHILPAQPEMAEAIASSKRLSPILAQVLVNRALQGMELWEYLRPSEAIFPETHYAELLSWVDEFLDPERMSLPSLQDPTVFPDMTIAVDRLERAVRAGETIAICGDFDVDGMTSTAVLILTLRHLGVEPTFEIPDRATEGYGINTRMIDDLQTAGVSLIITVDNGIAAHQEVAYAREKGIDTIVTDHHDVQDELPAAFAILNPKRIADPRSPYASIAGVGVAYLLALQLSDRFDKRTDLEHPLLELFTLGTIADLAQLTGINRRYVKQGLGLLANSQLLGVQELIQVSGREQKELPGVKQTELKPEAIGFRLGPRINAIGRIGSPATVIELLTTTDPEIARDRALTCQHKNLDRQKKCAFIEQEAIAYIEGMREEGKLDLPQERVLIVVDREVKAFLSGREYVNPAAADEATLLEELHGWNHGVIGIVASRLAERYGSPVFIGSYEAEKDVIRFSVRGGIPEFHVFESLTYIKDIRGKGGGHPAAGGFSLPAANLGQLRVLLREFVDQKPAGSDRRRVEPDDIKPLLTVDAFFDLKDISMEALQELDRLQPCGIGNPDPVFYSRNVRVVSQQRRGRERQCLVLELDRGNGEKIRAVSWTGGALCPVPDRIDVAYKLRLNEWQGFTSIELELAGMREPAWLPTIEYKVPPDIQALPKWHRLSQSDTDLREPILLYGYDRPEEKFSGDVDCDRPLRKYESLVLWSLPPSATHLRWLVALANPEHIYVAHQIPEMPLPQQLRQKIRAVVGDATINLLDLSQQWWVSPSAIAAGFRELGYPCEPVFAVGSLQAELARMQRWYTCPVEKLEMILSP